MLILKMVLKTKKEAHAPPSGQEQRSWKSRRQGQKVPKLKTLQLWSQFVQIPLEEHAQEKQAWPLDHHPIPSDNWVCHEEDRIQYHTSVHCGCQRQRAQDQTGCEENSGTLIWPKSTPWYSLTERRHMLSWLLIMMLYMLPIKLGSPKLSPAD